jgi:hypothetical protein
MPMTEPLQGDDLVESTVGAVTRILACAEDAVEAIASSTRDQVRLIEAEAGSTPAQEEIRRKANLAVLRIELARQSARLAAAYAQSVEELGRVVEALAELGEDPDSVRPMHGDENEQATIKMTLRERHTFEPPPWAEGETAFEEPASTFGVEAIAPIADLPPAPPAGVDEKRVRRRPWRLWQRHAA